jgi:hypothetical protein
VSVFNKIRGEGFAGSYPTVVRELRSRPAPRLLAAGVVSVPISTEPDEEAQFDFSEGRCSRRLLFGGAPRVA